MSTIAFQNQKKWREPTLRHYHFSAVFLKLFLESKKFLPGHSPMPPTVKFLNLSLRLSEMPRLFRARPRGKWHLPKDFPYATPQNFPTCPKCRQEPRCPRLWCGACNHARED